MRLLASGVDLSNHSDRVINGMVNAAIDLQLIEYKKLVIQLYLASGNVKEANSALQELHNSITMSRSIEESQKLSQEEETALLAELEDTVVEIDLSSIPLPKDRLIRRK